MSALAAALCVTRCMHAEELTIDGEPFCIECADLWLERLQALELYPQLESQLPPLFREGRMVTPRGRYDGPYSSPQLDAIREQWRLHVAALERPTAIDDGSRCWAVLSAVRGTRCDLEAPDGFLCVKHAAQGATVPGLGWRDGAPAGRLVKAAA